MKYAKLYPNDKKILRNLLGNNKRVQWLNRHDFSMNEKTFWNRVKYLEEGGYLNVIRHAGLKNLYSLTDQAMEYLQQEEKLDYDPKIFALTDFRK